VGDVVGVVVGLVVALAVVIWPWVAAASVGGFDQAVWQAVGRSKPVWFGAVLLVPLVGGRVLAGGASRTAGGGGRAHASRGSPRKRVRARVNVWAHGQPAGRVQVARLGGAGQPPGEGQQAAA
jgi:hypothetical protein